MGNLGTYYLQLASEVEGGERQSSGTEPLTYGIGHDLQVERARTELNYRTSAAAVENCLV